MVQVKVNEGLLEGEVVQNAFGGTFCSFKGIPYAQPPVGDLRFKAPLPPKPWQGVRSAKVFASKSFQIDVITKTGVIGSEDCLYLNVYTPNVKPDKPLPVMFWVHGGALISGSGEDDLYGPEFLIREDVVIVTINYRLEVLGFLCLDTEDVPGNAGMKDQVEALRWVNRNIANFGGDPKNITIFGESAGGLSVSYLLISPMTKGLFKRAIPQSGVTFTNWGKAFHPRERALALARQLGCYSEDDKELYQFFKNQPVETLVAKSVPIVLAEKLKNKTEMYFNVVAEKKFGNNERFFAGDFGAIHEGTEIMVGYVEDEGLINLASAENTKEKLELARDFPEMFVSKPFALQLTMNQQLELGKKIRNYFFNGKIDLTGEWETLARYYSIDMFIHPIVSFAKLCAKKNKVFLYKFTCKSERNVMGHIFGLSELLGEKVVTCHADDVTYLFNAKIMQMDPNSATFKIMEKVIKLWTNFAKFGNPTPDDSLGAKWIQYTTKNQDYLDIGNEFVAGKAPNAEDLQFWEKTIQEYGWKKYY